MEQETASVSITLDRSSGLYRIGEKVHFTIKVDDVEKQLGNRDVFIQLSCDSAAVFYEKKHHLADENSINLKWGLPFPGFLRCKAWVIDGDKKIEASAAGAFEPENILPVLPEPADFDDFWKKGVRNLSDISVDADLVPLPGYSCDRHECYKVSFACINNTRIYGFLSVPKGDGPFPALVIVPGAGPGANSPNTLWVKDNVITLLMNVHSYDPPQDAEELKKIHDKLVEQKHYYCHGLEDPEKYFFRRAVLGVYRAIEWLAQRLDVDQTRIVFSGTSQGGTMAFYQAALSDKLAAALSVVPGMGDHGGFLVGRHPHTARFPGFSEHLDTLAYYDIVNFARRIRCPMMLGVGFIDDCCFPSNCYPAYNALTSEKTVVNAVECGHALDENKYYRLFNYWLRQKLRIDDEDFTQIKPIVGSVETRS